MQLIFSDLCRKKFFEKKSELFEVIKITFYNNKNIF